MSVFEKHTSIKECTEPHLCLTMCHTEKNAKPSKEPNLIRIIKHFPHANSYAEYSKTNKKFKIGTISVTNGSKTQPKIISMFNQVYAGISKYPGDQPVDRLNRLKNCLQQISVLPGVNSLAFDYGNLVVDPDVSYEE